MKTSQTLLNPLILTSFRELSIYLILIYTMYCTMTDTLQEHAWKAEVFSQQIRWVSKGWWQAGIRLTASHFDVTGSFEEKNLSVLIRCQPRL